MIPRELIEEIRQRADIVDVISDYVKLRRSGRNYKGLCPFHQEKTPSFVVSPEKQLFHCFGCGAGGNVFTFLMRQERMSFYEAVKALAERYGIELPRGRCEGRRERYLQINRLALGYFRERLLHPRDGRAAREYLLGRGVEPPLWEEYSLGFAPPGWEGLCRFLRGKGVDLKEAEEVGLVIQGERGPYDRFRNRIIFPIFDQRGRVLGFGGRVLGEGEPKYLNSPDTPIYRKGEGLYGIKVARDYIIGDGRAILVEGYFDVLALAQRGVKNVVAPLGTALTPEQVRIIKPLAERVLLLFDGDVAGRKAALRAVEVLVAEGVEGEVALLPPGEDPDSYFRGRDGAEELLGQGRPAVEFYLDESMEGHDLGTPEGRFQAVQGVLPLLRGIKDEVRQRFYVQYVAKALGVEEELLLQRLRESGEGAPKVLRTPLPLPSAEETLVALMIHDPEVIPLVRQEGVIDDFASEDLKEVARRILEVEQDGGDPAVEILPLLEEKGLADRVFGVLFNEAMAEEGERALRDCLRGIRLRKLREERQALVERIRQAEREGDSKLLQALLMRKQILLQQERDLKGSVEVESR